MATWQAMHYLIPTCDEQVSIVDRDPVVQVDGSWIHPADHEIPPNPGLQNWKGPFRLWKLRGPPSHLSIHQFLCPTASPIAVCSRQTKFPRLSPLKHEPPHFSSTLQLKMAPRSSFCRELISSSLSSAKLSMIDRMIDSAKRILKDPSKPVALVTRVPLVAS
ncbi:uncharacterized protein BJX67DRAFT_39275 [Aspergillus lucknowensis]|uniref:Uncharacterized protein n=1 Tax=Aspergillus lucknowensis TaxID=176173 RepID=A0ABR4LZU5_9EURO